MQTYLDKLNDKHKISCPKCGEQMKISATRAGIPVWETGSDKYEVYCFCNYNHHVFGISYNAELAIEQAIKNVELYKKKLSECKV